MPGVGVMPCDGVMPWLPVVVELVVVPVVDCPVVDWELVPGCAPVPMVAPVVDVPVDVVCAAATPIAKANTGAVKKNFLIIAS
jgi:hypothetical protein